MTASLSPDRPHPPSLSAYSPESQGGACPRCGAGEIQRDEVFHRGLWQLAECARCHERWTDGPAGAGAPARRAAVAPAAHLAA